jgi:hypothetical protein
MLADLYVKSWSVLRTVTPPYPPLFRLFGLLAVMSQKPIYGMAKPNTGASSRRHHHARGRGLMQGLG